MENLTQEEQVNLNNQFMIACREANYEKMVQLLKSGANIDAPNIKGATPLMTSLIGKNEDLALWLIDRGANPIIKTNQGECPLIKAAADGMILALKAMVRHCSKEQINVVNNVGSSALMEACSSLDIDAVKILLDAGADVNIKSVQGTNALLIAAARQDHEIVDVLIKKGGANPNSVDFYGVPALIAACVDLSKREKVSERSNSFKTIKVLLKHGADPNLQAKSGNSPIAEASQFGNKAVVLELLNHGANPNTHCSTGVRGEISPLMIAALEHDIDLMKKLISCGADVNYANSKGERALGFTMYKLNPDETVVPKNKAEQEKIIQDAKDKALNAIKYLTDLGAQVGPSQKRGLAHFAVLVESKELLKAAANSGEIDFKDNEGHTALHLAFYTKKQGFINELLNLGADPNIQDENGCTPGHLYFKDPGIPAQVKQLIAIHKNTKDEKHLKEVEKLEDASKEIVKKMEASLLASKMDVNICDNLGNSVLMTALHSYANGAFVKQEADNFKLDKTILNSLIEKGGDITLRNENLDSPYITALKLGDVELIEDWSNKLKESAKMADIESAIYDGAWTCSDHTQAIAQFKVGIQEAIKHGAKIDYQDEDGQSALIIATCENKEELVSALLDLGATIDLENNEGETALIQAVATNRPNISKILLEAGADFNHQSKDAIDVTGYAYKYQRTTIINQLVEAKQKKSMRQTMGM